MKVSTNLAVLALPALTLAFPGLVKDAAALEAFDAEKRDTEPLEKRQSLLDAVTAAIGTATGLLGMIALSCCVSVHL